MAHAPGNPREASSPGPRQRGLWLGLAVAAGLALRLFRLGHQSLWVDEIFTWYSGSPQGPLTLADLLANTHGPLVSLGLHLWMKAFGDSEAVLRLPFALASTALIPVIAALSRRAAGERAFLPAAWLVALSPFLVWYGQELRNYAFAMLFAALQLLLVLRWKEHGRTRDLVALALAGWLGALTNLNTLLLFPGLLALMAASPAPGRGRWGPPLAVGAAVLVLWSPWLLAHLHVLELGRLVPGRAALPDEAPLRGATTFTWPAIPFTFYVFSVGFTLGPPLRFLHLDTSLRTFLPWLPGILASALVFGVLTLSGLVAVTGRRFARNLLLVALLLPLACVTYFAVMNFKVYNPRYVSVALPAYFVLLAAGWAALHRPARILSALAVAALFAVSLLHHYGDERFAKEDFRGVARDLRERAAPQDVLVATGNYAPLDYYWRGEEPKPVIYWLGYARDARMEPRFAALLNHAGPTWVVCSRTQDLDPEGRFEPWLIRTYNPQGWLYTGVRVYRIRAPEPGEALPGAAPAAPAAPAPAPAGARGAP